jgi:hypothetical protein
MTMIDTADSRFAKAVAIADQAGQWLKCRTHECRKAYGVPSQCTPGRYYLTTQASCTCEDAKRHPGQICKHSIAVQIHCARMAGQPMPASDVVDGLAEMVNDRHPVLDMVRHPDGEITWSRHEHSSSGETYYLPRPPLPAETVRLAAQYDRIFGRL